MVSMKTPLRFLTGLIALSCVVGHPFSLPAHKATEKAVKVTPNAENTIPAAPHFVIYSDARTSGQIGPPPVSEVQGYNVFALSFLLTSGAFDKFYTGLGVDHIKQHSEVDCQITVCSSWDKADRVRFWINGRTNNQRCGPNSDRKYDHWLPGSWNSTWTASTWTTKISTQSINKGDGQAEAWLASFTTQLRTQLPQGTYILSHAPVAPWFSPGKFGGGAYLAVDSTVGSLIDWYNVQFYNQGKTEYTTCSGLLTSSSSTWPQSAVFQIAASGIPLSKIVIGKIGITKDAHSGFMSTSTLASCVSQAVSEGWNAGIMVWEFPDGQASWIQAVRGSTF